MSNVKVNITEKQAVKEKEATLQLPFMKERSLTKRERQLLRDQLKSGGDIVVSTFIHCNDTGSHFTTQPKTSALITFKER